MREPPSWSTQPRIDSLPDRGQIRTFGALVAGAERFAVEYSVSQRPRVIDGQVTVRDMLDLTVAIDHNVVDGAPAARFAAEFRGLLESAAVISPVSGRQAPRPGFNR